ncbi:AMP-binding protein, partial [bacterium]|nr:AMP-binding protein [bacterium]
MTQKFYDNAQSIPELIQLQLNQCRNPKLLNYRLLNQWEAISTEGFAESVRRLATGLHSIGIKKGDSIGIIARSSPQWLMIDLAIMLNGAVSVPMFPNISSENFDFQRKDAEIKHLFIESDELLDSPIRSHLSNFSKVISWSVHTRGDNVMFYEELMRLGDDFS